MTLDFDLNLKCLNCPFGKCTTYIREQSKKMKDRNTLFRVSQNKLMACVFDQGIPGSPGYEELLSGTLHALLDRVIEVAIESGNIIEQFEPEHFGETEASFVITKAQAGKVRGDMSEMIMRALFWNMTILLNDDIRHTTGGLPNNMPKSSVPLVSVITLGDDYDLKQLFTAEAESQIRRFEEDLCLSGTGLYYSTPDFFVVNAGALDSQTREKLQIPISDLGLVSQARLTDARRSVEGKLRPEDVLMAFGLKTSIRSDRMYQFLYEANGFKAVWRGAFQSKPPPYFSFVTQVFGANYQKLASVEFLSLLDDSPSKAIDQVIFGQTINELVVALKEILCSLMLSGSPEPSIDLQAL